MRDPDDNRAIHLTRGELRTLMQEAVQDAFLKIGVDSDDPIEMQKDFQHLREWRMAVATFRTRGVLTMLALLISGCAAALWIGFKTMVTS